MNSLLFLSAPASRFLRQELCRGTSPGVTAARAASPPGTGFANQAADDPTHDCCQNSTDHNSRNHIILLPLSLPASANQPVSVRV